MRTDEEWKPKLRVSIDILVFIALSLVSFSALFLSTRSFVVNFRDLGLSFFLGARGGIHSVSSFAGRTVLAVRELAVLRREYAELVKRMTRYEQLERNAAEILQENNRLREQLGFSEIIEYRHIPAEIIGRDPDNLFSSLVINKGKRDGVAYNMPVIAFRDGMQGLVGKVVQAGQFESLVMPIYDVSAFVSARFAASRYSGLVEGQGKSGYPLLMRLVSKTARGEIHFGDLIVTSGVKGEVDAVYPAGINIGRVSRILYQEYETSMDVELESAIDFSRLEYVFVIEANSSDKAEDEREDEPEPEGGPDD
ncbi:MAG: rod shape-determining protein MreC [Spirochaetaceae bacterium]|jgi:rod shape-determining protein MreC|nr:rod shape-determining protein MreC [Spirochaetaceae bacterium]